MNAATNPAPTTIPFSRIIDAAADTDTSIRQVLEVLVFEGCKICKYADPVEEAREGLTIDEALDVAREDSGLIYLTRGAEAHLTEAQERAKERAAEYDEMEEAAYHRRQEERALDDERQHDLRLALREIEQ